MRIVTLMVIGTLVLGTWAVVHARQGRRASPHESVSGTVDGNDITITYGRPSMRGRMIFGRLVAWDRVWCPGADEATTLESHRELRVDQDCAGAANRSAARKATARWITF